MQTGWLIPDKIVCCGFEDNIQSPEGLQREVIYIASCLREDYITFQKFLTVRNPTQSIRRQLIR
jgi:hypothetical protein